MAITIQTKLSTTAQKRPTAGDIIQGELALNNANNQPGLFFKTANDSIIKLGPTFVANVPPNDSPAAGGSIGNSVGELWYDIIEDKLKVWDGSSWMDSSPDAVPRVDGDTGAADLPRGTTAERPVTPQEGYLRFNSDNDVLEVYVNGSWINVRDANNLVVEKTSNNGAAILPIGATAARPLTPLEGYLRSNSDTNLLEFYDGSSWESIANEDFVTSGFVAQTSSTGSAFLPTGTTGQRGGSTQGFFRFNTDLNALEVFGGAVWRSILDSTSTNYVPNAIPADTTDQSNSQGAAAIPRGPVGNRPSTSFGGYLRYRDDVDRLEFYNNGDVDWQQLVMQTAINGAAAIPSNITGNRPSSPVSGYFRHNTTTNKLEFYDGSVWLNVLDENNNSDFVLQDSQNAAIPVGATAGRINTQGYLRYNTTLSEMEYYDGSTWNSLLTTIGSFVAQDGTNAVIPVGANGGRINTQGYFRYSTTNSVMEFYDGVTWRSVTDSSNSNFVPTNGNNAAMPTGDTASRISTQGYLRFNTDLGFFEYNDGSSWNLVTPGIAGSGGVLSGATQLSSGSTAQRPTGASGYIRWNTSNDKIEFYNDNSSQWENLLSEPDAANQFVTKDTVNFTNAEIPTGTTAQRQNSIGNLRWNTTLNEMEFFGEGIWQGITPIIRNGSISDYNVTSWSQIQDIITDLETKNMERNDVINIILPAGGIAATSTIEITKDLGNVRIIGQALVGTQPRGLSASGSGGTQSGDGYAYFDNPNTSQVNSTRATNISLVQARYGSYITFNALATPQMFIISEGGRFGGFQNIGFTSNDNSDGTVAIEVANNAWCEFVTGCSCVGGSSFLVVRDSSQIGQIQSVSVANTVGNGIVLNQHGSWESAGSAFITVNMAGSNGVLLSNGSNIEQKTNFRLDANVGSGISIDKSSSATLIDEFFSFTRNSRAGAEIRSVSNFSVSTNTGTNALFNNNTLYGIWAEDGGYVQTSTSTVNVQITGNGSDGILSAFGSAVRLDTLLTYSGNGGGNSATATGNSIIRKEGASPGWAANTSLGGIIDPP